MSKETPAQYRAGFLGRVRAARETRFATQEDICAVLDMAQPKYSKYESRSLMPHDLIARFCTACGVSIEWLVAAKGPGPAWKPREDEPKTRQRAAKRRRAA